MNQEGRIDGHAPRVPELVRQVKTADDRLVAFVRERPVVAVCAALGLGYLIGRVVTRLG